MKKSHLIFGSIILAVLFGLGVYSVFASDSGAKSPGTMADDATVGTVAWSNPDNAKVSDNVNATILSGSTPQESHYLKATNFGFSIPSGATINGILVEIEKKPGGAAVYDTKVQIVKPDGSIGTTNKADTVTRWAVTEAYYSYGSSSDLWDENWTAENINDVDFGVVFSATQDPNTSTAYIDHIRITVYFSETGSNIQRVQIKSGTIQVKSGKMIIK